MEVETAGMEQELVAQQQLVVFSSADLQNKGRKLLLQAGRESQGAVDFS